MLSREQQRMLAGVGAHLAASALLDRVRSREGGICGGGSGPEAGLWFDYNRKGLVLEDHSARYEWMRTQREQAGPGWITYDFSNAPPVVTVTAMTWDEAAIHGRELSPKMRDNLSDVLLGYRAEQLAWSTFADARGGYPWRRRFESDTDHEAALQEWTTESAAHFSRITGTRERNRRLVMEALPLILDNEPIDLLEMLEAPCEAVAEDRSPVLQAARPAPRRPAPEPTDEALFTMPAVDTRPCY